MPNDHPETPATGELLSTNDSSEQKDFEEFEIGEHQVPWFLWVFFTLIVVWASVSWIPFFGY